MRLQLATAVNGLGDNLREVVEVAEVGDDWLDFVAPQPATTNPMILRRVIDAGADVLTLSQQSRTLEDVYLKIVEEDESKTGINR
jgi:hypothetical protein